MSTKNAWYHRTTWTITDREAFEEQNRRSRGADSKAQYIRIQADTLRETGDPSLISAALEMLRQSFLDYPKVMGLALAFDCAGQCCEQLSRADEAIGYYLSALEREKEFPGIRSNACFHLGQLAVEYQRTDLYEVVLSSLEYFGRPAFPTHIYFLNGVKAIIAHDRGDTSLASKLARIALNAAAVRDAGWGKDDIGVVNEKPSFFSKKLAELAGEFSAHWDEQAIKHYSKQQWRSKWIDAR